MALQVNFSDESSGIHLEEAYLRVGRVALDPADRNAAYSVEFYANTESRTEGKSPFKSEIFYPSKEVVNAMEVSTNIIQQCYEHLKTQPFCEGFENI